MVKRFSIPGHAHTTPYASDSQSTQICLTTRLTEVSFIKNSMKHPNW